MTDGCKVSVIIATYNTALYIEECLDSIFNQTLEEIEVILIDDGSTDNTNEIIKQYKAEHNNLITYYQKNQGAGIARNYGITLTHGEYMFFMDPDDKLPYNDCLERLYDTAKEKSVLICGGNILTLNGNKRGSFYTAGDGDLAHSQNRMIRTKNFFFLYGHTRYLYETHFIKSNNVCFAECRRFEDQVFTVKALGIAREFYELDYPVYEYRINRRQLHISEDVYLDIFRGFRDTLQIICDYDLELMFEKNYGNFIIQYMPQIALYAFGGNEEFEQVLNDINAIVKNSNWYKEEYLITHERVTKYKKEVTELKQHLVKILKCGKPIIIYGAGINTGRFISSYKDMLQNVIGIAISDNVENNLVMAEFPVRQIEQYDCHKEDAIVLVTPGIKVRDEILEKLEKMKYINFEWIDVNKVCDTK